MSRDSKVFVLGEDVGVRGGVFLATQGLLEEFGGSRVIDTPLAEASIMGIALGAAFRGLRPVPEVQFSDFVWPSVNQLIGEAARACYGTNGALTVPMVVRIPYGGGIRGGLFHSQNVESLFFHTPGLKVIAPATPYDAKGLLKSAIRDNNPVICLEHKKTYRLVRGEVPEEEYTLPIGQADIKRAGANITLVSYGLMLHYCLEAAEAVSQEGLDVEVVDLRTLKPLDTETVLGSVKKTGRLLIVHEDNVTGGVGAEVAALAAGEAFEYLDAPVTRLCGPDVPTMPFAETLEDAYMPNPVKIAESLRALAAY
jgi:2-oxoisovalerate dehydrogenase E1 component beta subunit